MASYTSLLLVIALCAATAHSLRCYTCTAASSNSNCQTVTNCSSSQNYCETIVGYASSGIYSAQVITKYCSSYCSPSSGQYGIASTSTSCCTTDLCNYSASSSTSTKPGCATIILALGAILTILKSSAL
ncbi:lymphocyte antigen 6E-like [Engystomops pustulosus]|uniref:lymphocyte antigen 6E-like n=1 Tax=Engystomops pustulosus TaxID=76066 RepID=UPI003AFB3590